MATIKLAPPPGYGALIPLDRQKHAGHGLAANQNFAWTAKLNASQLSAAEFAKASADYPIVFVKDEATGEMSSVVVFGLRNKENLFVNEAGDWEAGRYVPANLRRYPFCIAELPQPDGKQAQNLVCVEAAQLRADSEQPLFTAKGEPTPQWETILKLLEAIEGARQQTRVLAKRLESLNLLVPFDALALPKKGQRLRLQGLFRVDEEKLATLTGRDLSAMAKKGELRAIYAHLLSLENFGRLMDRASLRQPAAA